MTRCAQRLRAGVGRTALRHHAGLIAANLGIGELPLSLIHNVHMNGLAHLRIANKAAYRAIRAVTLRARAHPAASPAFLVLCRLHAAGWESGRNARRVGASR